MAEELITRLFRVGSFEVIERRLLDKVLDEQKMSASGLLDVEAAQKIGSILGVESIVVGTIIELSSTIRVNARILSSRTGMVAATAGESMEKDDKIDQLLTIKHAQPAQSTQGPRSMAVEKAAPKLQGNRFYHEDFETCEVGTIPHNWVGFESMAVVYDGKKRVLKPFEWQSMHKGSITDVAFPNNCKVKWTIRTGGFLANQGYMRLVVGGAAIMIRVPSSCHSHADRHAVVLNNSSTPVDGLADKIVSLVLEKRGSVFTLFCDDREVLVARYENFKSPRGFSFDSKDMEGRFQIRELSCEELP